MYNYIDVHSHLHFKDFDNDRQEVLDLMNKDGIATIAIGTDYEESKKAIKLAEENENIYATIGFHPADNSIEVFDYEKYLELAKHKKVLAIGECGLDYFHHTKDKDEQVRLFKDHIRIACEVNKPLMLHVRPKEGMDAYNDAIEILKEEKNLSAQVGKNPNLRGNFHFFVGDLETTRRVLELGFTVSFSGVITFVKDYIDVVKFVPLEMMHAETDSPYVAPVPFRGKRNSPLYVKSIVEKIAEIKGLNIDDVKVQLIKNAKEMFDI